MPHFTRLIGATLASVLMVSAFADTSFAQSSDAPEDEASDAPESQAADAPDAPVLDENGLALGQPEDDSPKPGETYIKEVVGDWSLRCIVVEGQDDPCQMYQLLTDPSGQPISEYTLFRLPEGGQAAAGATIVVPLETSLQQQLAIKVDDQAGKRYPYLFCDTAGCYARIGLTAEDVTSYKAGNTATITLVPALDPQQRPINLTMSLNGFTAAFDQSTIIEQ